MQPERASATATTAVPAATQKRRHEQAFDDIPLIDELAPVTATNQLGIPNAPPYSIRLVPNATFDDVVSAPDLDYVRKVVQVALKHYTSPKTANVYITFDGNDNAYEITISFPGSMPIDHDMFNCMYRINPMLVTKKPWTLPSLDGNMEIFSNVSIRVASHRRKTLKIVNTHLMMWETEETILVTNEEVFGPPGKRQRQESKNGKK